MTLIRSLVRLRIISVMSVAVVAAMTSAATRRFGCNIFFALSVKRDYDLADHIVCRRPPGGSAACNRTARVWSGTAEHSSLNAPAR